MAKNVFIRSEQPWFLTKSIISSTFFLNEWRFPLKTFLTYHIQRHGMDVRSRCPRHVYPYVRLNVCAKREEILLQFPWDIKSNWTYITVSESKHTQTLKHLKGSSGESHAKRQTHTLCGRYYIQSMATCLWSMFNRWCRMPRNYMVNTDAKKGIGFISTHATFNWKCFTSLT